MQRTNADMKEGIMQKINHQSVGKINEANRTSPM